MRLLKALTKLASLPIMMVMMFVMVLIEVLMVVAGGIQYILHLLNPDITVVLNEELEESV